ncbi:hypothetical protein [Acetivibrio clariflavus]|uniref:Uncharacterized protein n=1 Tax=Acetivibrio clariflavus (strain DSM 19732 / NBRC 101661 / EBR45) TaxID=720554 RepID=G8LW03_ACECE|nr:hypothetical protein [Acetivibrio clariflavus]AEV68607.1 hypothetical protein Clocl_2008 [Acetivibrio clariflavus DSM 19732]
MDTREIFDEINQILEEADMDIKINDLEELEEFLEEYEARDLEVYEEIHDLYEQLLMEM